MKKVCNKKKLFFSLLIIILCIIFIALIANKIVPHDPYLVDMSNALRAPYAEYILGTDNLGRCVFSRIVCGAAPSLFTSFIVVITVLVIGTFLGVVAAYTGGITDKILMRINVVFQSFPDFVLAIAVAGMLGNGLINGIIALSAVYWTKYARLSRSLTLEIKDTEYIKAARLNGAKAGSIMMRHIIPNIISSLVVMAALDISSVIMSMAGLSFLGLGAQRPSAEWGMMMSDARNYLQIAPWMMIFPGVAIFLAVIIFNLFADTLRDLFDTQWLYKN